MLSSAFAFMKELIPAEATNEAARQTAAMLKQQFEKCLDHDEKGRIKLTVTLPDASAIENLAESLARLMTATPSGREQGDQARHA